LNVAEESGTGRIKSFLRVRMGAHDAHYLGSLVAGAKMLELIGDAATELAMRNDGDEGLFRAYDSVEFLAPVHAGDFLEVRGWIESVGRTSRRCHFEIHKVAGARADISESAAEFLSEPVIVCRASGTVVVPQEAQRLVSTAAQS
jgi:3-aminobutyryl-CoA ammonia-lyase